MKVEVEHCVARSQKLWLCAGPWTRPPMVPLAATLLVLAAVHAAPSPPAVCSILHRGLELGRHPITAPNTASTAALCCELCVATPACSVFSFSNKTVKCTLNTKLGGSKSKSWATSGVVRGSGPAPAPPGPAPPGPAPAPGSLRASVHVAGGSSIFTVEPHYLSYTIDTSDERGFFARDLTNPKLQFLAKQLSPAVLRVGGSGGDRRYTRNPPAVACDSEMFF